MCEHTGSQRQKFNGGNPVYVCDECDMIVGYVHEEIRPVFYVNVRGNDD